MDAKCGHEGPCDHCPCVMWRENGEVNCPVCGGPHPAAPPPTLAEACEVIEALLLDDFAKTGDDPRALARAFLGRVKSTARR